MATEIKKETKDIVRAYVALVAKEIPVSATYIFGSHAKGTNRPTSDIDVAIISPRFGADPFRDGVFLQKKLWESSYKNMDVVGYSPAYFENENSPLVHEIKSNGVLLPMQA